MMTILHFTLNVRGRLQQKWLLLAYIFTNYQIWIYFASKLFHPWPENGGNTSRAAKGALAHCLQRCTACKIQYNSHFLRLFNRLNPPTLTLQGPESEDIPHLVSNRDDGFFLQHFYWGRDWLCLLGLLQWHAGKIVLVLL